MTINCRVIECRSGCKGTWNKAFSDMIYDYSIISNAVELEILGDSNKIGTITIEISGKKRLNLEIGSIYNFAGILHDLEEIVKKD